MNHLTILVWVGLDKDNFKLFIGFSVHDKTQTPRYKFKDINLYPPNYFKTYRSMRNTIFIQEVQDGELKYTKERTHGRLSKLYKHNTNFNGRTYLERIDEELDKGLEEVTLNYYCVNLL